MCGYRNNEGNREELWPPCSYTMIRGGMAFKQEREIVIQRGNKNIIECPYSRGGIACGDWYQEKQDRIKQDGIGQDKIGWVRIEQDMIGQGTIGSDRIGQDRIRQDRIGQDRIGQGRVGQDRVEQDRIGQDKIGQDRVGQGRIAQTDRFTDIVYKAIEERGYLVMIDRVTETVAVI